MKGRKIPPLLLFVFAGAGLFFVRTAHTQEELQTGYAILQADPTGRVPVGTALFAYRNSGGILVAEASVPAVVPIHKGRIFVDQDGTATGIAFANTSSESVTANLVLRNSQGDEINQAELLLGPREHLPRFVDQFFPEAREGFTGSLTFATDGPEHRLATVTLRQGRNAFGEALLATLPVADLGTGGTVATGDGAIVFPHIGAGSVPGLTLTTQVILINPGSESIRGSIRLTASDGTPMVGTLEGITASEFPYELSPNGVLRRTLTSPEGIVQGFATVDVEEGPRAPIGTAVFQFRDKVGQLISETGVGAIPPTTAARIFADTVSTQTGVAIANPGDGEAVVRFQLLDRNGFLMGSVDRKIPANGHTSVFINGPGSLFEDLPPGFTGLVEIQSNRQVIPITLKLTSNERADAILTTLPVADLTRPVQAAFSVFPQIGFGLGFSTRLILISTDFEKPLPGMLYFRRSNGTPLELPMLGEIGSEFPYELPPGSGRQLRPGNSAIPADILISSSQLPTGEILVNLGNELHLRPVVIDSQNEFRDDFELSFHSLDPEIAAIDSYGRITGQQKGFSTLTLSTSGLIKTATITVADVLEGISGVEVTGIAQDQAGRLYLSSPKTSTILLAEDIQSIPGTYAGIENRPGLKDDVRLASLFDQPSFLVFKADGELFVSDSENHVIRKIEPGLDGRVQTIAGSGDPGEGDGPALSAGFRNPSGVALDERGYLWVADSGNHTIRRIDLTLGQVTTIAGSPGHPGLVDGVGPEARFQSPAGLALETESPALKLLRESRGLPPPPVRIIVADSGNGVIRIVSEDGVVSTLGFPESRSAKDPRTRAATGAGSQGTPRDVAVDASGNIFVTDADSGRVLTFLRNGDITLAAEEDTFQRPQGIAITRSGRLVVTDSEGAGKEIIYGEPVIEGVEPATVGIGGGETVTIRGRNFSPEVLLLVGGTFAADYSVEDSRTILLQTPPLVSGLTTLTVQARGGIAQTDLMVEPTPLSALRVGDITTVAGGTTYSGDGRTAISARISAGSMTLDPSGNFYFADPDANRIRRIDAATGIITSVAGSGLDAGVECGFGTLDCEQGDGGPAVAALLSTPFGLSIGPDGTIWIADSGADLIRKVDPISGIITTVAGGEGFSYGSDGDGGPAIEAHLFFPVDVEVDEGTIFIAEGGWNGVIRRIGPDGIIDSVAGGGEEFVEGGPALDTNISYVGDLEIDPQKNILFVDIYNNRVRQVDSAAGTVHTVAGNGCDFVNDVCYLGDGGPALDATLAYPVGVDLDQDGNIFVADGTSRIRRVAAETGIIDSVAGNGSLGTGGDGGPATEAEVGRPEQVLVDGSGNIFIGDSANRQIRKVDGSTGLISTFAGSVLELSGGDGGAATAALFDRPEGIAIDSTGDLYIADTFHHRIRRIDSSTGVITTVVGSVGTFGGYSGDGGPATEAELYRPSDVAVDQAGNIYVAADSRIRKVDGHTGVITTVAGNGDYSYSGDGGPAVEAGMDPTYLAVDSSGNLYLSDSYNDRIRRIDPDTGVVTTIAGNGIGDFSGDGGPATQASLWWPAGITIHGDQLFVADSLNGRIRVVNLGTGIIETVAGEEFIDAAQCDGCYATDCLLSNPTSVAVDGNGNLYLAEEWGARIRRVDSGTGLITTLAGYGRRGFGGDGEEATAAKVHWPTDLAVDSSGNVFIVDSRNNRIRAVRGPVPQAKLPTLDSHSGNGTPGYSGDGGPARNAALNNPLGLAVDANGNLYIADERNHRVRKVDTAGTITTVAGTGQISFSGDGGPATEATLAYPSDVALDGNGNLYIADNINDRIRKVSLTTGIIHTVAGNGTGESSGDGGPAGLAGLPAPGSLAIDDGGNLFVSEQHRVRRIDASSGIITTVAGTGTEGFSGDGGPAIEAQLSYPTGLTTDSEGDLFIADQLNWRIRRVDATTGIITTVAGSDDGSLGLVNGWPAVEVGLVFPVGVAFDKSGDLLIAEGSRIRRVDMEKGTISTIAGSGDYGFSGDEGPATAAVLRRPQSVAVGPSGKIYISDTGNNRIRVIAEPD